METLKSVFQMPHLPLYNVANPYHSLMQVLQFFLEIVKRGKEVEHKIVQIAVFHTIFVFDCQKKSEKLSVIIYSCLF